MCVGAWGTVGFEGIKSYTDVGACVYILGGGAWGVEFLGVPLGTKTLLN